MIDGTHEKISELLVVSALFNDLLLSFRFSHPPLRVGVLDVLFTHNCGGLVGDTVHMNNTACRDRVRSVSTVPCQGFS